MINKYHPANNCLKNTIKLTYKPFFTLIVLLSLISVYGQPLQSNTVGKTEGNFSIDLMGRANYSMPLEVPPGINGMEPKLSINYNSGGPNSILGQGFSIGGLSAITRAGTNLGNSDKMRPMSYTADDKLYLDGQLLVLVNGTPWATGAEYRTETETFAKIVYTLPLDSTPGTQGKGYFTVWDKDGNIYEYGNGNSSKLYSTNQVNVKGWSVSKATDRMGNYMSYNYTAMIPSEWVGNFAIQYIDYTGNSTTSTNAFARVAFNYENRPDALSYWSYGDLNNVNKRLKSIDMYSDVNFVKKYSFFYNNTGTSQISKLYAVQEMGRDGLILEPTTFLWDQSPANIINPNTSIRYDGSPDSTAHLSRWGNRDYPETFADLNGDGKTDFLVFDQQGVMISLANGTGFE